jgi:hypothetical protein
MYCFKKKAIINLMIKLNFFEKIVIKISRASAGLEALPPFSPASRFLLNRIVGPAAAGMMAPSVKLTQLGVLLPPSSAQAGWKGHRAQQRAGVW